MCRTNNGNDRLCRYNNHLHEISDDFITCWITSAISTESRATPTNKKIQKHKWELNEFWKYSIIVDSIFVFDICQILHPSSLMICTEIRAACKASWTKFDFPFWIFYRQILEINKNSVMRMDNLISYFTQTGLNDMIGLN